VTKAFQGKEYKLTDNIPRLILTAIKADTILPNRHTHKNSVAHQPAQVITGSRSEISVQAKERSAR
jgi:hypothetical protein